MAGRTKRSRRTGQVEADLTIPGHPEIFAIGDTVSIDAWEGKPVPGIAPAAKQQGKHVAETIKARLRGAATGPFRYKHAGSLAQIGKRLAVIDFGKVKLRGTIAWWIWGIAHIYFLIGLRHRLSVALSWLWIYARDQRAARLITQGQARWCRRSSRVPDAAGHEMTRRRAATHGASARTGPGTAAQRYAPRCVRGTRLTSPIRTHPPPAAGTPAPPEWSKPACSSRTDISTPPASSPRTDTWDARRGRPGGSRCRRTVYPCL